MTIRQRLYAWSDLVILALGIIALIVAPQVGFCLNDTSSGAMCASSGTLVLDLAGFGLIVIGATWVFARRWPRSGAVGSPDSRFIGTWMIFTIVASAWAYLMLLDWHLLPYCSSYDTCTGFPDVLPAIQLFLVIGFIVAAVSTAIGSRVRQGS